MLLILILMYRLLVVLTNIIIGGVPVNAISAVE